jgi:3-deoxy-D-manno-octulosonate 8-phosphate phosphatase (KDO 8-P phosphatase)
MAAPALSFPRTAAARAGRRPGHEGGHLRRRRRADRRPLYIGEQGETVKAFHARRPRPEAAGAGGIEPVVITGRDSPAVRRRVADLGLARVYGVHDKLRGGRGAAGRAGPGWAEVAAIGDDWPDLPLLLRAGLACAPANAHAEVKAVAHHVTAARRPWRGARVLRPAADGRAAAMPALLQEPPAPRWTRAEAAGMAVELHLPDLPEVPLSLGPARPTAARRGGASPGTCACATRCRPTCRCC